MYNFSTNTKPLLAHCRQERRIRGGIKKRGFARNPSYPALKPLIFRFGPEGPEIILIFVVTTTVTTAFATTATAAEATTVTATIATATVATAIATATTVATTKTTTAATTVTATVGFPFRTIFTGLGNRDIDGFSIVFSLVELFNSLAAFFVIGHFNKTETSRFS